MSVTLIDPSQIKGGAAGPISSARYVFAPQAPGGNLIVGSNSIIMTPVPAGVNGNDAQHYLYIRHGAGLPEDVLITGGTGRAGDASGQIIIQCANTHSGAWTIETASSGIKEAAVSLNGVGTIELPLGNLPIYAPVVIPTSINLIGQSADFGLGVPGTILQWYGGAGRPLIVSAQPDGDAVQFGNGIHRNYSMNSPDGVGDSFWMGGDPAGIITPQLWQGSFTNLEFVRSNNFYNGLVINRANFITTFNCAFGCSHRALLIPNNLGVGLQYCNMYSTVFSVGTGAAVEMNDSSFGSGQIMFYGGQVAGTIIGTSLNWHSFGTHYEPNASADGIVVTNGHSCIFHARDGLMGTHNVASGIGTQLFFDSGLGLSDVLLSGVAISDTSGTFPLWVDISNGASRVTIEHCFNFGSVTKLYKPNAFNLATQMFVQQPEYQTVTLTAAATLAFPAGNCNLPDAEIFLINGATVGGSGITAVTGMFDSMKVILYCDNAQTFTAGASIGNTITLTANTPYTAMVINAKIWIKA